MTLARPIFAGLAAALLLVACSPGAGSDLPNVVVIVMDTTRPDMLSAYGHPRPTSPFLETLARDGTRFDRAYSSSSWTLPSHASLFTGLHPKAHGAHQGGANRLVRGLPQLQEQLTEAGYQTAGFSGNIWIAAKTRLGQGFEHFENRNVGIYQNWNKTLASDPEGERIEPDDHYVVKRVQKWLRNERDTGRPLYLFVNLVEPHLPYLPDWEAASYFLDHRPRRFRAIEHFYPTAKGGDLIQRHYGRQNPISEPEWAELGRMYEGTLRLTDRLVEAIVRSVEEVDGAEDTLVFVLSDHGENLGDHGHFTHILNLYDSNLRIVLVARGPGIEAGVVEERPTHITDVHATILAAAGAPLPPGAQGVDLRAPIPPDRVLTASLEFPVISLRSMKALWEAGALSDYEFELSSAIGPRYKLIERIDAGGKVVGEELYDLIDDPGELRPLRPREVDARSLALLRATTRAARDYARGVEADPADAAGADLTAEEAEAMRALGYLGEEDEETDG